MYKKTIGVAPFLLFFFMGLQGYGALTRLADRSQRCPADGRIPDSVACSLRFQPRRRSFVLRAKFKSLF